MKPCVLLIRADANVAIGTGHVMRCLALAQAWRDAGGNASFAVAEMPEMLRSRLTSNGFHCIPIEASPAAAGDAAALVAEAGRIGADWVVVDGDRFGSDFLNRVRRDGQRVLLIDDFAERDTFPADLILNANLGADAELYRTSGLNVPVLTGPRYVLLRREFRRHREPRIREKADRVLVTLGGSDPEDLTPRIASALVQSSDLQVTVVAGAGYPHVGKLREISHANLRVVVDSQDMAELMMETDLAIIAAGGTLWELLTLGCTVLSYSRNTVQARVVHSLAAEGIVVDMGDAGGFDPVTLVSAVRGLAGSRSARERMAFLGREIADGLGALRVVEALQHYGAR
jgi:UDP-2,4-diacetamido-2,4,6-trideoxy-beta-L-altropyranose hydrolase